MNGGTTFDFLGASPAQALAQGSTTTPKEQPTMTTEEHLASGDHRVQFDFEIDFSNSGGIQGQGFRLDIDDDDISDEEPRPCRHRPATCGC